ncbi:cell wall anchor protein [Prolixibacteraceae bacterium JC049]|nr:cell wall anchor protein [Prolixibacteraceae bacterium JC049]
MATTSIITNYNTMRHLQLLFFISIVIGLCNCGSSNEPTPPVDPPIDKPTETDDIKTDPNKTFIHPGMLHGDEDFLHIKAKVDAKQEPWLSGWNKLINNSHTSKNYKPNPVETLIRAGNASKWNNNFNRAFHDAAAAYQQALCWKITGDEAYATKAVEILNAWGKTCKKIDGDSDRYLGAGLYGYQFANAAEIMRDYKGWNAEDFTQFKNMMLTVFYPKNKDFLDRHNNACITHYWANWDLCNIASAMAIGILADDASKYNYAIDYLMKGKGNGRMKTAIYHVHEGHLGQMQESGRDQNHTLLCIGLLGTICEMAWHQGDDLYGYDNNRLLAGAEYAARYNFANLPVPFKHYNNCDNVNHTEVREKGRGEHRPIWQMIYNHYVVRKGIQAPYTKLAVRVNHPEGGGGNYNPNSGGYDSLGFGTLLYNSQD